MKLFRTLAAMATTAALTAAMAGPALAEMPEKTLSIATASKNGAWFAFAAAFMAQVEKANPSLTTQVQPGGGLSNIDKVQKGQIDLGMTLAFAAAQASAGTGAFEEPRDKVAFIATLFPGYYQFIVRKDAGIQKFEDLFDKRLAVGKVGWAGELMFRQMLEGWDMDYDKIQAKGGVVNLVATRPAADMMRDGNLDAVVLGGNPPTHPVFAELALTTDIDLLQMPDEDLDKIFADNPTFSELTIPPNPYKGVAGGFRTIGGYVVLVGSTDLSEEAVYEVVKGFYGNLDTLKEDSRAFSEADLAIALKGNKGMPIHPGAAKYYKEIGLMD